MKQGDLGDCWFLASASALAEHPARVEKVFGNRGKSKDGFYVFEFFFLGEPKYVVVDDRLPIEVSFGQESLYNAQVSDNGAWWLPILEKAFAKYTKTYLDMSGGFERVALRALTGMPTRMHRSQ